MSPSKKRTMKVFQSFSVSRPQLVGIILLLSLGSFYWIGRQVHWSPSILMAMLFPQGDRQPVYSLMSGIGRQQAREQYRASLNALQEDENEKALTGFHGLEKAYPGLLDLLLIHEADAYSKLGQEKKSQERLSLLMLERPNSPLRPLATYQLAQSYFRSQDGAMAKGLFEEVRQRFPQTPYAIGSLYYLGALALQKQQTAQAVDFWKHYLQESPDGRFSGEITSRLEGLLPHPSAEESQLLGLGYAQSGRQLNQAVQHLKHAPFQQVWFELGKSQLQAGQKLAGIQALVKGLPYADTAEKTKEAVDFILKEAPQGVTLLKSISQLATPVGGDYLYWRLAQVDPNQASQYYALLLSRYPKGDYAPESSWQLLWPMLKNGQYDAFKAGGDKHLAHYPYSRSASKVLFWEAKVAELRESRATAIAAYHQILERYPNSYYAFRASRRLIAVEGGKDDPGWRVETSRVAYPPDAAKQDKAFHLEGGLVGNDILEKAEELKAVGAGNDLLLLFKGAMGEVPAPVQSWIEFNQSDRAKGIRTIRDYLDQRAREGYQASSEDLKLLYPIYFSDLIQGEARQQNLDPYLVQSLMREESYFNEYAVSGSNARGLMQLMPTTAHEVARWVGQPAFNAAALFIPQLNIRLGTRYLGYLHETFSGDSMLAVGSYNGGPNAMKRWLKNATGFGKDPDFFVESIPYEQTRDYIKKVYTSCWNYHRLYDPQSLDG